MEFGDGAGGPPEGCPAGRSRELGASGEPAASGASGESVGSDEPGRSDETGRSDEPGDPEALARAIDPWADRVVIDDFFAGDGAGGSRSRAALALLRETGAEAWAEPGYADDAAERIARVLGPERVVRSQVGFNDLVWLA